MWETKSPVWLESVVTIVVYCIGFTALYHLDFPPMIVTIKACIVFLLCESAIGFFTKIKDYLQRAIPAVIITLAVSPLF